MLCCLYTDSSFRFERGVDPDIQVYALKRAALLMKELRKDIEQMKQLTDNLDAADEAKVTNSTYIESYNDITVYTKPGLTDDSYVVYASYKLKFTDIKAEAPGLSQLYVMKNEDGSYIMAKYAYYRTHYLDRDTTHLPVDNRYWLTKSTDISAV